MLTWREKEEFLSFFKAWSWTEGDLSTLLFEELLNIINKENIEELEEYLIKSEGVEKFNDLCTNYRVFWTDLEDFINREEEEE